MANLIESVEQLKDWKEYREFLKVNLKKLEGEEQAWISKKKIEFQIEGKTHKGFAFLAGKKGKIAYQKCKANGEQFYEGVCTVEGKNLRLSGFKDDKFVKEAAKTFLKLKLGWKVGADGAAGADGEAEGADSTTDTVASAADQAALKQLKSGLVDAIKLAVSGGGAQSKGILEMVKQANASEKSGDFAAAREAFEKVQPLLDEEKRGLVQRAGKIEKAVQIWSKTEELATKELRKLQKAIMSLNDPRGAPVIKGLEGILKKLDKVDDEAREAADAAQKGDAKGFEVARDDFVKKVDNILDYVSKDELIKDADSNPSVSIKIQETLMKSLNALKKAV